MILDFFLSFFVWSQITSFFLSLYDSQSPSFFLSFFLSFFVWSSVNFFLSFFLSFFVWSSVSFFLSFFLSLDDLQLTSLFISLYDSQSTSFFLSFFLCMVFFLSFFLCMVFSQLLSLFVWSSVNFFLSFFLSFLSICLRVPDKDGGTGYYCCLYHIFRNYQTAIDFPITPPLYLILRSSLLDIQSYNVIIKQN